MGEDSPSSTSKLARLSLRGATRVAFGALRKGRVFLPQPRRAPNSHGIDAEAESVNSDDFEMNATAKSSGANLTYLRVLSLLETFATRTSLLVSTSPEGNPKSNWGLTRQFLPGFLHDRNWYHHLISLGTMVIIWESNTLYQSER